MNWLASNYSWDGLTVTASDCDALPNQYDRIPATNLLEAQEPLLLNVADDQPNLIDMADDCQSPITRLALYSRR